MRFNGYRFLITLLFVAGFSSFSLAAEEERIEHSPNGHMLWAAKFIATAPKKVDPYQVRFFSFYNVPDAELEKQRKETWFFVNSTSRTRKIKIPLEVPGSEGRLYYCQLTDYGWTTGGFKAVADKEPFFMEPWVEHRHTEYMRRLIGVNDQTRFHAQIIVRGDWLVRDGSETFRSETYYNLLFGQERFGGTFHEYIKNNSKYKDGFYTTAKGKNQPNFPANETDFNKAFGADVAIKQVGAKVVDGAAFPNKEYLSATSFQMDFGAIVDEGDSTVSYHNRLLWAVPNITGSWWKTFDVSETAGKKDIVENLFDFDHDADELIVNLVNGGQAYLLTNNKGKRLEVADPDVVRDTSSKSRVSVRTWKSCVSCHELGINVPRNIIPVALQQGVELKTRSSELQDRIEAFFLTDLGKQIKKDQDRYSEFVKEVTGYDPAKQVKTYLETLDNYEKPMDIDKAVLETGITKEKLIVLLSASTRYRTSGLVVGRTVPRGSWDADAFREVMLLENAAK